jgi:hypothetical protein
LVSVVTAVNETGIRGEMNEQLAALLQQGEEKGCVNLSELHELVQELEPDDAEVEAFYAGAQERDVEIRDDCGRQEAPGSTYVNGDLTSWPSGSSEATRKRRT